MPKCGLVAFARGEDGGDTRAGSEYTAPAIVHAMHPTKEKK